MRRSPAGGGIVLLLMIILDFGHSLHVEVVKRSNKPHDRTKTLARYKREWIIPPVSILEEQDNSYKNPIARIRSDIKIDPRKRIRYIIVGRGVTEPPMGLFIINERTGDINVTGIVDREEIDMFFLKGYAKDEAGNDVEPPIDLRVSVEDINDNNPVFTSEVFVCSVEEMSAPNTLVMVLNATDADKANTVNTKLAYRIISQEPGDKFLFMLTKDGQVLTTAGMLDREQQTSYSLEVEVKDRDGDPNGGLSGTAKVKIKVKDVNDNIPVLEREEYSGEVEENIEGVEILRMKAFDNDEEFTDNWFANFTIISGNEGGHFQIITDEQTNEGVLMLVKEADYEVMQNAQLSVIVSNRAEYHSSIQHLISGGSSSGGIILGGAAGGGGGGGGGGGAAGGGGKAVPIKVRVKNVREGPVFKPRKKTLVVSEGKKIMNSVIGSYQAFDSDTGKVAEHVKYAKEYDPDNWFTIDPVTAEIRLTKQPDRESLYVVNGSYVARILAISEDLPGKTATGTISIDVEDANDNCPVLVNAAQTVCESAPFINLTALDKDSYPNSTPLKFTVLDEPAGNSQQWSIGKTESSSAQLIPKTIWVGSHQVTLLITDNQGLSCAEKQVLKLQVCSCQSGVPACSERLSNTSVGLGGGAVALIILACLLLLLVPLLLLLCSCGSKAKGFLTVPEDGPEGTILIHNKEGPVPEDTAVMSHAIGVIGAAGAGAGAAAGAGMLKGSGYAAEAMDGYDYSAKGMYSSSMYGMGGRYEEHGALLTAGEMAAGGGAGMRAIGVLGSGSGAGAGGQVSFGAGGSQAVLNEEFMRGYFFDKGMLCADEDMAQASKDCILMYSQEGTGSIAGSVGCCSLMEGEFEDDRYLDDLGLKFKVLADICLGTNVASDAEISKYTAYEEARRGAVVSQVVADIDLVEEEEEVEQRGYEMESSYMSSESRIQQAKPVARENVVTEESLVTSRYMQEPIMRGNVLVTEKTYTTAPTVFFEPVHTQNVLVTERVIRPASSLHNVLDLSDAENVMVTERVIKSDQELSGLMSVAEAPDSQYLLVTERVLGPSNNSKAAVSIPDVSRGQSMIVTERHFTPISGINGGVVIPAELSAGPSVGKESISISEAGSQGRSVYTKGGFGVEEVPSSSSTVGNSTSRVTKYSKVHYTRS